MSVSDYLKSLGSTSKEVAANLRLYGIKGIIESNYNCPILNAIYKACPDYWPGLKIIVGYYDENRKEVKYYATLNDDQICDPTLPEPVQKFIADFDRGAYPDLED